ncbi:TetR/AcrR family transcriptional regulator [Pseudomonas sp. PD9R]|uniref:TetR/AcrR family transcriptional regulator n=1 Tax=Pseudomonas sp. PD9R TaxID=2853534 RepID=UPI001C453213|nr:TetR/AcrR family transcriptional regulator [Pseudomonas sp. PD9R]MBV6823537.1 TetR/AcrR family transcriptional regulator [Pseudomonas sp. PD9R]
MPLALAFFGYFEWDLPHLMSNTTKTKAPARYELVMNQLMEAAERLFAQKGVAGTSLQELAEAVGLTRTGIYHYVKGKDEMLETLVRGFTLETARDLERLASEDSASAMDRLREGVTNMACKVAQHPQRFRLLLTSEGAFPEALAKQYRTARKRTLAALTDLVAQSIREGSCRAVNDEMAAFSLLGVCNWVAFWYPHGEKTSDLTPEQLSSQLTAIALEGLVAGRDASGAGGIAQMIGLLREDIDRLEGMIVAE